MNWTKEEILEYNKKCAEFLGYELITPQMRKNPEQWKDNSYWEHKNKANVHTSKKVLGRDGYLSFHSDWDWIMEVVEAIEQLKFRVEITSISCCIYKNSVLKSSFHGIKDKSSKKEAIVQAINQFLIWYNNEKSNK